MDKMLRRDTNDGFAVVAARMAAHLADSELSMARDIAAALAGAATAPRQHAALDHFPPAGDALQTRLDSFFQASPDEIPPALRLLFEAIAAIHPAVAWRAAGGGTAPALGAVELMGPAGVLPCATLRAGFYFQPPHFYYRRHQHAAEEIYMPISGIAQWLAEGAAPNTAAPLALIHHLPNQPHACRTGESPLLAFWAWSGDIRMQTYRFCEDAGETAAAANR